MAHVTSRRTRLRRGQVAWQAALLVSLAISWLPAPMSADEPAGADSFSFVPVDVFIDPLGKPLAAYQLELVDKSKRSRIVAIEGGECDAFSEAPHYDPWAMNSNRVVLAAFSTEDELPSSRIRVATIHVLTSASHVPKFRLRLLIAATADGTKIKARASYSVGEGE